MLKAAVRQPRRPSSIGAGRLNCAGTTTKTSSGITATYFRELADAEVSAAFGKCVRDAYHDDFLFTGIGHGECGSYPSSSYAQGERDKAMRERRDSENMQVVDTGWSYGG